MARDQVPFGTGTPKPQGRSVGLPHSSPLMKLPSRPAIRPMPGRGATKSKTSATACFLARANTTAATMTPVRPPWNDMPPSQM